MGVDHVCEINRRRTSRQGNHIALGAETEYLILEHRQLGMFQKLFGLGCVFKDIKQIAQPAILNAFLVFIPAALFIGPVRGNTVLVDLVHLSRADLHFDAMVFRAKDGGMYRPVTVGLGR